MALTGSLPAVLPSLGLLDPHRRRDPFTLGVASGDPLPDGVVLWTRLAPDPLEPDGGMDRRSYPVEWEVATDEHFGRVVRRGQATARPELAHTVHVDVRGLAPWRDYHYRFRSGGYVSPVGRTRTAPLPGQLVPELRLAVASCQASWDGWYTAHRDLASRRHDVVLFLGDYIYEFGLDLGVRPEDGDPRNVEPAVSLDDYRRRYAAYKLDRDLQAAHLSAPWIVVPDDHEVTDNWAGDTAPTRGYGASAASRRMPFLLRRAHAFRAYWEHMPLRLAQQPHGADAQLYRRLRYGRLAELSMLDTRQYRDPQVGTDPARLEPVTADEVAADPQRTMMGAAQEAWLLDGLARSDARWNVLGHQTAMSLLDRDPGPGEVVSADGWDGYAGCRDRILGGIAERGVRNVVGLAGDVHRTIVSDLARDAADPDAPSVATEFVGTSISSAGDGVDLDDLGRSYLADNPHMRFGSYQRGYLSCRVTPQLWQTELRVCDRVTVPDGSVTTRATFVVENGSPRVLV